MAIALRGILMLSCDDISLYTLCCFQVLSGGYQGMYKLYQVITEVPL